MLGRSIAHVMRSTCARFAYLLVLTLPASVLAQPHIRSARIDSDKDPTTGCAATAAAGSAPGIELGLIAGVSDIPSQADDVGPFSRLQSFSFAGATTATAIVGTGGFHECSTRSSHRCQFTQ
jgi:hypothetical protein